MAHTPNTTSTSPKKATLGGDASSTSVGGCTGPPREPRCVLLLQPGEPNAGKLGGGKRTCWQIASRKMTDATALNGSAAMRADRVSRSEAAGGG